MALELFKPFVMQRLANQKLVQNIKAAKKWVERVKPEVWDVLEQVIKDYLVLLNRAPSLHRLSIQAFEAILIEGSAIQLHPLVCTAFNADFDGDQMAVHVPLSEKAQQEARLRMLSKYNILSPATGDPIITPSQDIVLGCFYLTIMNDQAKGAGKVFTSAEEALLAFDKEVVGIQAPIWVRMENVVLQGDNMRRKERDGTVVAAGKRDLPNGPNGEKRILLETSVGRLIFNNALLEPMRYRNHEVIKDGLKNIIADCYKYYTNPANLSDADLDTIRQLYPDRSFSTEELHRYYGSERTAEQADKIKALGFHYAMRGGMTVGVQDIKIPDKKASVLNDAEQKRRATQKRHDKGASSEDERYREIVGIWTEAGRQTTQLVREMNLSPEHRSNPVSMMVTSQARGNINQLTQLAGMRGLMADPTGKIIELPIKSNFREGLTVLEYFVSTHGGRKGLADTALRTADAGYLTRRLIDVAQDNIVTIDDCGTVGSLLLHEADSDTMKSVADRGIGRVAAQDIVSVKDGSVLVVAGTEILEDRASKFATHGITHIYVRSALFCQASHGICRKCYGRNLATGKLVEIGEAVGIIAAQSIGEPGTQLTLRTFHTGGVASADDITQGLPRIIEIFEARVNPKTKAVLAEQDGICKVVDGNSKDEKRLIITDEGNTYDEQIIPDFFTVEVRHGDHVVKNQILARTNRTDIGSMPIRARHEGIVHLSGNVITVVSSYSDVKEIDLPANARIRDNILRGGKEGIRVFAGQLLTEGAAHPQELLEIQGRDALQTYMIKESQRVYRPQGVQVNDKHLEVIIRQMLRRVRIDEPGDTNYLPGETVDISEFDQSNADVWAQGGMPAVASSLLHGITKASLNTDSFLSAASFQETTRVLTEAAINGKIDHLRGLKENVVIGKLIPAGTGAEARRQIAEQKQKASAEALVNSTHTPRKDVEEEPAPKPVATATAKPSPLSASTDGESMDEAAQMLKNLLSGDPDAV
jgi:DNA-directed RNA polymerase subunit beta'